MERTFSTRLKFEEILFTQKNSIQGDKIDLSFSIPSKISGLFG